MRVYPRLRQRQPEHQAALALLNSVGRAVVAGNTGSHRNRVRLRKEPGEPETTVTSRNHIGGAFSAGATTDHCALTRRSSGRGETTRRFLLSRGPRRLALR